MIKKMKKLLFTVVIFCTLTANAQEFKRNAFELDFAIGSPDKIWEPCFDIGVGWLHNYSSNFAWDILRLQIGNSFKNFDAKSTGFSLQTGPKVYFSPVSQPIRPFLAFRAGCGGAIIQSFDNIGFSISPEIGINISKNTYISLSYAYSWSSYTVTGTTTESYITGYHQVYLYSQKKYMSVPEYGSRTVNTSTSYDTSGGNLFLRLGFNF